MPDVVGSRPVPPPIPMGRAIALGAVQGPTELLPVSSSAHLSLIPWLREWEWDAHDAELRKSFEIALHAGAAVALLLGQRRVIASELASLDRRKGSVIALSFLPPVAVGLVFERQIEKNLGGPFQTAIGLLVGAAAMALADQRPKHRSRARAGARDGLALGIAQACALAPGVSRNGATLTAARWRGFGREHANMLSRTVALPVIVGAAVLKGARLRRRGLPREHRRAFAAGTATSFVSTLASQALIGLVERDSALWPYSAYRAGLASVILVRLRHKRRIERERAAATVVAKNGHGSASEGIAAARAAEAVARREGGGR